MDTCERIEEARQAARGVVVPTPLFPARLLSELTEVPVWLKVESFQRTGSFKVRGAYESLRRLPLVRDAEHIAHIEEQLRAYGNEVRVLT